MEGFKKVSHAAFVRLDRPTLLNTSLCKVPWPLTYRSLPSLPLERLCFPRGLCSGFHCLANKATLHFSLTSSGEGEGKGNTTPRLFDRPTIYSKESPWVLACVGLCLRTQAFFWEVLSCAFSCVTTMCVWESNRGERESFGSKWREDLPRPILWYFPPCTGSRIQCASSRSWRRQRAGPPSWPWHHSLAPRDLYWAGSSLETLVGQDVLPQKG